MKCLNCLSMWRISYFHTAQVADKIMVVCGTCGWNDHYTVKQFCEMVNTWHEDEYKYLAKIRGNNKE